MCPSNSCILSHLLLALTSSYVRSCSKKPAFGHMEGLAFFTKEKALVNETSSELIRKPITIAAALETPALQWTRTTPSCNKNQTKILIIHLRKVFKLIAHSYTNKINIFIYQFYSIQILDLNTILKIQFIVK